MHILCTICSDLVNQAENIFVTKCGHIFHYQCLSQWIERSKSCPQCRNKVTEKCMFRLYPTISNETNEDDAATLQSRLDDALLQLRQQNAVCKEKETKLTTALADVEKNIELVKECEKKLVSSNSAVSALKSQLEYVKIQNKETQRLREENEGLKKNMQTLHGLQQVLNATETEVEQMLQGYTDVRTIATFATALKRALCESENKKRESRDRLQDAIRKLAKERATVADFQMKIGQLESKLSSAERKYESLKNKRKASDISELSFLDDSSESVAKKRASIPDNVDLNKAVIMNDTNTSLNSMVSKIENADSPYLNLKQSSLALSALQRSVSAPDSKDKPSEFSIVNSARSMFKKGSQKPVANHLSIFHKKELPKIDLSQDKDPNNSIHNISYDGLGGHSKLDVFPVPNPRPLKSLVPKLTAKHRLKRPTPSNGSQDIVKMLERMQDKDL